MKHSVKTDPECPACKGFGIRLIAADARQRPDAPSERRQVIEMCDSPVSGSSSRPSDGIFRTMGVCGPTLAFQLCSCLHLETTDGPVIRCIFCGAPAEGNYSIHLSRSMTGREAPLCDAHGQDETLTCDDIWSAIESRDEGAAP